MLDLAERVSGDLAETYRRLSNLLISELRRLFAKSAKSAKSTDTAVSGCIRCIRASGAHRAVLV